jgi:hypothetical protein
MAKTSISVDDADLAWLKRRAKRLHGGNLSAAMAEATQLLRHLDAMSSLLDLLGAPKLSASELADVAAELDAPAPPVKRRKRAA